MDFSERLSALSSKVRDQRSTIETEEAAKNAFVMPFISTILGYDVFNPREVIPEFTADVGVKRGEKVDYAINHNGDIQILIECKRINEALRPEHASQLFRYFSVTNARIAILTNGEIYQFYTDLDAPNKMDAKPFLVLDLNDIDSTLISEVRKLTKDVFDLDSILNAAEELKYLGQIKRVMAAQFREPADDWVRFFTTRVYEGAFTQRIREQFTPLVAKASQQFLTEQVNERLKTALGSSTYEADEGPSDITSEDTAEASLSRDGDIETTLEEIEGFHIVRAIVCSELKIDRIAQRDAKSYFAILVDDNNRKPIARLHFNTSQKYLGVFDADKKETRIAIDSLDEIYQHAGTLRASAKQFS